MRNFTNMDQLFEIKRVSLIKKEPSTDDSLFHEILSTCPGMSIVIQYLKQLKPIEYGEYRRLFERMHYKDDYNQDLFHRIFDISFKKALIFAVQYHQKYNIDLEDTFQTACIGIILAIRLYYQNNKGAFSSLVSRQVHRLIDENIPISESLCPFPIDLRHKLMPYELYISNLSNYEKNDLISNKSFVEEISTKLNCNELLALQYISLMIGPISLEELINTENTLLSDDSFQENIAANPSYLVNDIINSIHALPDLRAQRIILERYGFNGHFRTLGQIGEEFRLSRERIRQIENKAIRRLDRNLKEYKTGRVKRMPTNEKSYGFNNINSFKNIKPLSEKSDRINTTQLINLKEYKVERKKRIPTYERSYEFEKNSSSINVEPLSEKSGNINSTQLNMLHPSEFQKWLRKHHVPYGQSWKVYCAFLNGSYYSKSFLSNGKGLFDHHSFDALNNNFIYLMSDDSGFHSYDQDSFDIIDEYASLFYTYMRSLQKDDDQQQESERNQRIESLKKCISDEKLKYIDERRKGGTIWIIGALDIEESIKRIEQKTRITFRFQKSGPKKCNTWWAMNI